MCTPFIKTLPALEESLLVLYLLRVNPYHCRSFGCHVSSESDNARPTFQNSSTASIASVAPTPLTSTLPSMATVMKRPMAATAHDNPAKTILDAPSPCAKQDTESTMEDLMADTDAKMDNETVRPGRKRQQAFGKTRDDDDGDAPPYLVACRRRRSR